MENDFNDGVKIPLNDKKMGIKLEEVVQKMKKIEKESKEEINEFALCETGKLCKTLKEKLTASELHTKMQKVGFIEKPKDTNYVLTDDSKKYGCQKIVLVLSFDDEFLKISPKFSIKWDLTSGIVEKVNEIIEEESNNENVKK